MECLVRVPYQFHSNVKSVCHTWLHLISHPSFFQQRLQSDTAEHLVCLVQPIPPTNFSTTSTTDDDPLITSSSSDSNKIFKNRDEQEQQHIHSPPQYALSIYNALIRNSYVLPMFSPSILWQATSLRWLGSYHPGASPSCIHPGFH
ncbi:hypothetical protein OIU84_027836 [Salix udensis]|uniref:Uncharacterized protein n=1 Tax=Salix udensis TaxID=889485 RepID=A0AAD6KBC1_9ROSI|nr:hypothetical protein OIU84_027836 [Salix udensis]